MPQILGLTGCDAVAHEVTFDGSGLASGVYFYRIEANVFTGSGKMVLIK